MHVLVALGSITATPRRLTQGHAATLLQTTAPLLVRSSSWVRWCGLLISTSSLEVMGDYSRYCGCHISTSLTLNLAERPGALLCSKVLSYLRPKMHVLLLDSTINGPATLRLNIYQVRRLPEACGCLWLLGACGC